jgi:hypothetical protein
MLIVFDSRAPNELLDQPLRRGCFDRPRRTIGLALLGEFLHSTSQQTRFVVLDCLITR